MFTPKAASDKIRKGIRMARIMYSSAMKGTAKNANAMMSNTPQRSCAMGKIC
jgi:hypothetical protein